MLRVQTLPQRLGTLSLPPGPTLLPPAPRLGRLVLSSRSPRLLHSLFGCSQGRGPAGAPSGVLRCELCLPTPHPILTLNPQPPVRQHVMVRANRTRANAQCARTQTQLCLKRTPWTLQPQEPTWSLSSLSQFACNLVHYHLSFRMPPGNPAERSCPQFSACPCRSTSDTTPT